MLRRSPAKDTPLPEKAAVTGKPRSEEALHRDTPPASRPGETSGTLKRKGRKPNPRPPPNHPPCTARSREKSPGLLKMRGSETPAKKEPRSTGPSARAQTSLATYRRSGSPGETVAPSPHQTAAMRPAEPAPPAAPVPPQKKEEALARTRHTGKSRRSSARGG